MAGLQSKVISTASSSLGMKKQCKMGNVIGQISERFGIIRWKFRWCQMGQTPTFSSEFEVSTCFNMFQPEYLSVLTMSFFHHSFKSLEQTYVLYELLALPEPFLKQQHSLLPMTAKDGKFPTTKHPK
jgi:hypothetical protein